MTCSACAWTSYWINAMFCTGWRGKIGWEAVEERFGDLYSEEGRPGIPIRLMVGLHYLKHAFNESDETVVARWVENPYWQYFCGEEYFRYELPIDPSQMTRFRHRIGEAGCEFMLGLTIQTGLATRAVLRTSLSVVNVDTTVQDKAIVFPTDARLCHKARGTLVRMPKAWALDFVKAMNGYRESPWPNTDAMPMPGKCNVPGANRSGSRSTWADDA